MEASIPTSNRPTYADIEALPPNVNGEILGGELIVSPRPAPPHAHVGSNLGAILNVRFAQGIGGPGGWWIHDEPELSLGVDPDFDPVIPDLAGWRVENLSALPDGAQYPVTPDWVCEILSPSTRRIDRMRKVPFYARAGVGHCWLVDPIERTVEVLRLESGRWVILTQAEGNVEVSLEPFGACPLSFETIWPSP